MKKKQFLRKLNHKLYLLQHTERKKYIRDYEEMIAELMENGKTEEEAILKLGNVKQISKEILENSEKRWSWMDWKGKGLILISFLLIVGTLIYYSSNGIVIHLKKDGPTSVFLTGKVSAGYGIYIFNGIFIGITGIYLFWKRKNKKVKE